MVKLLAVLFAGLCASLCHAKIISKTGRVEGPTPYTYATVEDDESSNLDVVYVFHGGGGDESNVISYAEEFGPQWKSLGLQPPRFVGLSFGSIWMLTEKNPSPASGKLEVFIQDFVPRVEGQLLSIQKMGRRLAIGHSMGGLNILNVVFRRPELFDRVAFSSPALIPLSPFASEAEIKAFVQKTGALESGAAQGYMGVREYLGLFRQILLTEAEWLKISPEVQVPRWMGLNPRPKLPGIFMTAGQQDKMFYSGAENCAHVLSEAQWPNLIWKSMPGDHGDMDFSGMARFLSQF